MSYSPEKGIIKEEDPLESRPWTSGQRVHMFGAFFTQRRSSPPQGVDATCDDWIKYPSTAPGFILVPPATKRSLTIKHSVGDDLLRQPLTLRKTLERVCSKPIDPKSQNATDTIPGEEITCSDGNCQPPPSERLCPDGTTAPCMSVELCADKSVPPCEETSIRCEDGSSAPCANPSTCPKGQSLKCSTKSNNPVPGQKCPNGTAPPCGQSPSPNSGVCPAACNPHQNKCDPSTAPTCVFPDPRVSQLRAACSCRPGWKITGAANEDTSKHWRLPIIG
jgi:hypothetical protein